MSESPKKGGIGRAISFPAVNRTGEKWSREKNRPWFTFEYKSVPDAPEDFGRIISERMAELDARDLYPEKRHHISEEAEFVEELDTAIGEFNLAHPELGRHKLDLRTIALVLKDKNWHGHFSREYVRGLNAFLVARYELPETAEFSIVPSEGEDGEEERALTDRTMRSRASARFREGLRESWKRLYAAVIRQEMEETTPERARERAHTLFFETDEKEQQARLAEMKGLSKRLHRTQFQKIYRELIREAIGPVEHKDGKRSPTLYAKRMEPLAMQMLERAEHSEKLKEALQFVAMDAEGEYDLLALSRFLDAPIRQSIKRFGELLQEAQARTDGDWDPDDFKDVGERVQEYQDVVLEELVAMAREAREEYLTMSLEDLPQVWGRFGHGQRTVFLEAMREELLLDRNKIAGKDLPAYAELSRLYQKCRDTLANGNEVDVVTVARLVPAIEARRKELEMVPKEAQDVDRRIVIERPTDVVELLRELDTDKVAQLILRSDERLRRDIFNRIAGEIGRDDLRFKMPRLIGETLTRADNEAVDEVVMSSGTKGTRSGWTLVLKAYKKSM